MQQPEVRPMNIVSQQPAMLRRHYHRKRCRLPATVLRLHGWVLNHVIEAA